MASSEVAEVSQDLEDIRKSNGQDDHEFWFARELMSVLGYNTWESFAKVVRKAQESCINSGLPEDNHFRQATKKVELGSGATRDVEDVMLSRFACYRVAQNGDPKKPQIAISQAYFAVQTRRAELVEQHYRSLERLEQRENLKASEKLLSGALASHGVDGKGFGIIRSKGDKAFFGGNTTADMKALYGITQSRALGDYLSPVVMSAKTLINEMTRHNVSQDNLQGEARIGREHVTNSKAVRETLTGRGIHPEDQPAEEDIKKVERRLNREIGTVRTKQLPEQN